MLAAWVAWTALSVLWGPDFPPGEGPAAFHRWILTPLMLWPVMARPWIVLGAIGIGGVVQVAIALSMSWDEVGGWRRHVYVLSASRYSQMLYHVHCAMVLTVAFARLTPWWAAPIWMATGLASAMVWFLAASRAMMISFAAGLFTVVARPGAFGLRPAAWTALVLASASLVLGLMLAFTPAGGRMLDSLRSAVASGEVDDRLRTALYGRYELASAAIDIAMEAPVFGGGRGAFKMGLAPWFVEQEARNPELAARLADIRGANLNDAHNVLLQNWADGGIPGAVLITVPIFWLGWRLWRQSAGSLEAAAALGLYMAILVGAFLQPITIKAPGAIIAVALAVSWSPCARAGSR
jgi:O-antigen ligase